MRSLTIQVLVLGLLLSSGTTASTSDRLEEGKAAYQTYCASCHDSGKDGAPITSQSEAWEGRSQLWDAVLFEHAEKGYLNMPARGGAKTATSYEVKAAAEYMVTITHPQLPHD